MNPILSQKDLDKIYSRITKDGGVESKGPPQPLRFDSPESEANFRRLIFADQEEPKVEESE